MALGAGAITTLIAGGCGQGPRDDNATGSLPTSASQSGGSSSASASAGGTGSIGTGGASGSGGSGSPIFDVAPGMTSSGGGDDKSGCDKVDFLFVIDNSGSMGGKQANLIQNFPGFIHTIQDTLDMAQDYHIMVTDVDDYVFGGCETLCASPVTALPCTLDGYQCGVTMPMECEDILGAAVTYPRGTGASNKDCMFTSGARYMDSTEPDLVAAFDCAAQVGTGSMEDPERPMEAMAQAVTASTPAWACNQGFLRDDAILVVTFITDENDDPGDGSAGTVEGWHDALVAAKHGDETAVVVLGLFGDNGQPNAICQPLADSDAGAEASPRLRQFVESWGDHGFAGSVCASSYEPFFTQAVDLIDTTCTDFTPPG